MEPDFPAQPESELAQPTDRERLAYLDGWVTGAQYAMEHPTEQTLSLAFRYNKERLKLWEALTG